MVKKIDYYLIRVIIFTVNILKNLKKVELFS